MRCDTRCYFRCKIKPKITPCITPHLYLRCSRSSFSAIASNSQSWVEIPNFGLVGFRGRMALTSSILVKVSEVSLMLKFFICGGSGEPLLTEELPRLIMASIFLSPNFRVEESGATAAVFRGGGETAIISSFSLDRQRAGTMLPVRLPLFHLAAPLQKLTVLYWQP